MRRIVYTGTQTAGAKGELNEEGKLVQVSVATYFHRRLYGVVPEIGAKLDPVSQKIHFPFPEPPGEGISVCLWGACACVG